MHALCIRLYQLWTQGILPVTTYNGQTEAFNLINEITRLLGKWDVFRAITKARGHEEREKVMGYNDQESKMREQNESIKMG